MLTQEDLRVGYQYFFKLTQTDNLKYNFLYTDRSAKMADKALQQLNKQFGLHSLGHRWLFDYLCFQFNYWGGVKIEQFSGKVDFAFIFGEKAVKRYIDRDKEFDYQIEDNSAYKSENYFSLFKSLEENDFTRDDNNRRVFLNTDRGFLHCIQTTSLYNHKDKSCIECKFNIECKGLLKTNYPHIYKNRRYR